MIPIGDSARRHTTPWVNYAFILLNVLAFILVGNEDADFFLYQKLSRSSSQAGSTPGNNRDLVLEI